MSNEKILQIGFNEDHRVKCKLTNDPSDDRYIFITPQDIDLPKRYQDAYDAIHEELDKVTKLNDKPETEEEARALTEAVYCAGREIFNQIDYIFGKGVALTVFGQVSPLTVDNNTGEYIFEKFLNCMNPIIESEFGVSVKKVNARVKKYTSEKGAHPAYKK